MYQTTGTQGAGGRTLIRIGGPQAPKVIPMYSVPIQTTATLNIQLMRAERTNASGIGSGSTLRPTLSTGTTAMTTAQPKGILKTSQVRLVAAPEVSEQHSGSQYITRTSQSTSSAGTMTSAQSVTSVGVMTSSGGTEIDLTGPAGSRPSNRRSPTSSIMTTADIHPVPKDVRASYYDTGSYDITQTVSNLSVLAGLERVNNVEVQASERVNGIEALANSRVNSIEVQTTQEISPNTTQSSQASTERVNQYNHIEVQTDDPQLGLLSKRTGNIQTSTDDYNQRLVSDVQNILSNNERTSLLRNESLVRAGYQSGDSLSSGTSTTIIQETIEPIYASINPNRKQSGADSSAPVSPQLSDVPVDDSNTRTSTDGVFEASIKAAQLQNAGVQLGVVTPGGTGGAVKRSESDVRSGSDGGDSDAWVDNAADANSFRFLGWNVNDDDEDVDLPCMRVLVMKEKDMVVMFSARCTTEKAGNDPRLLSLMVDIADSCVKHLRRLKDKDAPKIGAEHMDTLPLKDGRQLKIHLAELSEALGENVTLTDVAFRFQPQEGAIFLGTFVQGTVFAKRNYAIGRVGVVASLIMKNKFAPVEAFSEQLCEHIASTRPATLGTVRGANTKLMNKSAMSHLQHLQRDQLLLQNFIFDPTIVVAEAARRSFVKIDGFLLFK